MENSKGMALLAIVIAVIVFLFTPGVIWTYSFNGNKNLVQGSTRTTDKANKMVAGTHAAAVGALIAFSYPILQKLTSGI